MVEPACKVGQSLSDDQLDRTIAHQLGLLSSIVNVLSPLPSSVLSLKTTLTTMTPNPCSEQRFTGKSLSHLDDLDHTMSVSTASSLSSSSSFSDEGGSSSSGEEGAPFEVPSAQLMGRIVSVVEGLFSDENLIRDEFMNKNTRKNRGGYVNLKLLASFRKVKYLTKDWRAVAHAIAHRSTALELSEEGTKVRRKQALHTVDGGSKYDRTVFVLNLPAAKEDVNQLHRDFAVFGRIGLIRLLRVPSRSNGGGNGGSSSPSMSSTMNKLLTTLAQQVPSVAVDQAVGAVEFNQLEDAQSCLQSHHRLIDFDPVWSEVMLSIIKKSETSSTGWDSIEYTKPSPTSRVSPTHKSSMRTTNTTSTTTTTTTLPQLGRTVINKPVDDQSMIVITVTSSGITLTSTTSGNGNVQTAAAKPPVRTPFSPIIRQPKGPDGTRGFTARR